MSLGAVAEVKADSKTENQMSNKEVASPLSSSESEAVVPQSVGEHRTDMEESKCQGDVQYGEQQVDEKRANDATLGNEVVRCKSPRKLRTVESNTSIYKHYN